MLLHSSTTSASGCKAWPLGLCLLPSLNLHHSGVFKDAPISLNLIFHIYKKANYFWRCYIFNYICNTSIGFCGREARHGSAKAPTPVRIRSEPHKKSRNENFDFFLLFYLIFSSHLSLIFPNPTF
jgi:hypothetical protein